MAGKCSLGVDPEPVNSVPFACRDPGASRAEGARTLLRVLCREGELSRRQRLPGDEALLRSDLERRILEAGRGGVEAERLIDERASEWSAEAVGEALAALEAAGTVAQWNRRWLAVRTTDWLAGVVQLAEDGDAVVRVERGAADTWSVRSADLKGAEDGDRVLIRPRRARRRRAGRLPRAVVVKRLGRRRRTAVGTLEKVDGGRRLVPFSARSRLRPWVEGGGDLGEDEYVVVELLGRRRGPAPERAAVREILGPAAAPGVDVQVVLRHHEIPEEVPGDAAAAASALPAEPRAQDLAGRRDLRGTPTVTIDGETARDFDDAISVEETGDGGWRLGVHIADVAHYVPEGGALDLEAYRRGTSVYFPDRAVPMLPERLSNGLCSLRPNVPRLTVSAFLTIDSRGRVTRRRFAESVIRSSRRLTYAEVARLLEEPQADDPAQYGEVLELLRRAERLMRRLLAMRLARGSIDFDLPEGDVILDTEGFTVGIRPGERTVAHRVIEEFMIAANEAAARRLATANAPALYRVHDPPDEEALERLREILAPLGLRLRGDLAAPQPSALQAVLRRVEGRPEEPFVSSLVLRSMQQAIYAAEPRGHYALASHRYSHFTSPIRRYPDLVVQRSLKALIRGDDSLDASQLSGRLPAIAVRSSTTERRAEKAERVLLQWKLVRFLAGRVGERFAGRVTSVQPFGLFVQLAGYFVDGLVPIRSLADDFYLFDPIAHTLTGRQGGRVFRLADEVEVELVGVSERHRGLDLKIAGMPDPEDGVRPRRRRQDRRARPGTRRERRRR